MILRIHHNGITTYMNVGLVSFEEDMIVGFERARADNDPSVFLTTEEQAGAVVTLSAIDGYILQERTL
jgi:hypothetical protein